MKRNKFNTIEEFVRNKFKKNPRSSVSACFRSIKKQKRFFGNGDYAYLAYIILTIGKLGVVTSRHQIRYALNQSSELSGYSKGLKNNLINQLIKLSPVATNTSENSQEQKKKQNMMHTSSMKGNY